jgi:hypothetical protein
MSTPGNAEDPMARLGRDVVTMATHLFDAVEIPFERTSEVQRQVLAAFAFGIVNAAGMKERLAPPEVHALAIVVLTRVFRYSPEQAAAFAQDLIKATSPQHHRTTNAIIHRGIDGHMQWERRDLGELRMNVSDVLRRVCG